MTREEIRIKISESSAKNVLLELATGVGKSKSALDLVFDNHTTEPILIVVPRLVLFESWKKEFVKWEYSYKLPYVNFTTYASLKKQEGKSYQYVIYDECHHLSKRCMAIVPYIYSSKNILLSATIKPSHFSDLQRLFHNLYRFRVTTKEAIKNSILPDPIVYLLPLKLNYTEETLTIVKNKDGKAGTVRAPYKYKWSYTQNKQYENFRLEFSCTERQYYADMCGLIDWYKSKSYIPIFKNKWLKACLDRLSWLSDLKEPVVKEILKVIDDKRSLTLCHSIEQTKNLGEHCINSKNDKATEVFNDFQEGRINHITACDMLNEGVNLVDCQVGVFASLHSSEILIAQRNGRLLRHQQPIFIIPYYVGTREAEIVKTMIEDYNPELIKTIKSPSELANI